MIAHRDLSVQFIFLNDLSKQSKNRSSGRQARRYGVDTKPRRADKRPIPASPKLPSDSTNPFERTCHDDQGHPRPRAERRRCQRNRTLRGRLRAAALLRQRPAGRGPGRAGAGAGHDDGPCACGLPEPAGHRAGRPAGGARGARRRRPLPGHRARGPARGRRRRAGPRRVAPGRPHPGGPEHPLPAGPAGAAGGPPDRFFHRSLAHAARPHRARRGALERRHAWPPRGAGDAGFRPRGDSRLRACRDSWAGAASSSSRATAGAGTRWRT